MDIDTMIAAMRLDLSDVGENMWEDEDLIRCVDRAVADLSRFLPRELVYEETLNFSITDEGWTSGSFDEFISLANKDIRVGTDIVTSEDKATKFTRDVDYTIKYITGEVAVKTDGSMEEDTEYLISYSKNQVSIDISSLSNLIRVDSVEYPAGNVPQSFVTTRIFGSSMIIESSDEGSQSSLSAGKHVVVRYYAGHTPPIDDEDGSYPAFLDNTVILAAEAYALFSASVKSAHNSCVAIDNGKSLLGGDDVGEALDYFDEHLALLNQLYAAGIEYIGSAASSVGDAISEAGDLVDDLTGLGLPLDELLNEIGEWANGVFNIPEIAIPYITGETESVAALLAQIATDAGELRTAISNALSNASQSIINAEGELTSAAAPGAEEDSAIGDASSYLSQWSDYINKINIGKDVPAYGVQYAQAALTEAQAWARRVADYVSFASARYGIAGEYTQEAAIRIQNLDRYLAQAQGYTSIVNSVIGIAGVAVQACSSANLAAAGHLEKYRTLISLIDGLRDSSLVYCRCAEDQLAYCQTLVQAAGAIINKLEIYLGIGTVMKEYAAKDMELSQIYRQEAVERRNEAWNIWRDPKQYIGDYSIVSLQQLPRYS